MNLNDNKDNNELLFAQESPKPLHKSQVMQNNTQTPWKLLVIDDDSDIHAVTTLVLKGFEFQTKHLQIFNANSAKQAQKLLQEQPDIHLALVDVVMESDNAGLQLVDYIRNSLKNRLIRLFLRTGQPGQAPEAQVIQAYDINGYLEKTELSAQKLITAVTTGLRSYAELSKQHQQLDELRLDAAAGNKAKEAFIANISHEIRTPLTAIQGFAENLLHSKPTSQQTSALSIIIDSSKHLTHLLEDLISLSRLEANEHHVQLSPVHLPSFLLELIDLTKHLAKVSKVEFTCHVAQPMPENLHTDAQILRQVLLHLLNNAIKFTTEQPKGTVSFQVSYTDDQVLFQIEDNGMGMSTEEQQRMFNAFQQGETRNTKNTGLGIGLTLSQKYLNLLNSDLCFTPVDPHGSCFIFYLQLPKENNWSEFQIEKTPAKSPVTEKPSKAKHLAPPKEKLENLYELALQGYLQDIVDEAERLHEWDARFHHFADELRRLSENFEKTELCKYLKSYLNN